MNAWGRIGVLAVVAALGAACSRPAPPMSSPPPVAPPPSSPPAAPTAEASPAPPPPEAPPAPSAVALPEVPVEEPVPRKCTNGRCDVEALKRCDGNYEARLGALDEMEQCLKRATQLSIKKAYREAMMNIGYQHGALLSAAAERLVRAGVLSPGQARALMNARFEVSRNVAGQHESIESSECNLREGGKVGLVELRCQSRGGCVGGCRRAYPSAIFRVEATGLRVVDLSHDARDDGSCGCCF